VAGIKDKEPNPDSKSDSKNTGKRQIINVDPTVIIAAASINQKNQKIQKRGSTFFIHRCG